MEDFRTEEDTRRPRRREWQQRNQYTEDWGIVRGEAVRKNNAVTLSSLRCIEEEGFTTEDTESTEKENAPNLDCGRLR
jgi:hypothetical protein